MKNENNNSYTAKKAVMFFIYAFVCSFSIILTYCHIDTLFNERSLQGDLIFATMCGLAVAASTTFIRIKAGQMGNPIVNLRKYKYWAFTELVFFFFCLFMGVTHLFDQDAAFIVEEIVLGVFFGLFCSGVDVLYLIRKDKCSSKKD